MPVNKNAYLRFRIIDQCLNNPYKKYNRYDLANAKILMLNKIKKIIAISFLICFLCFLFLICVNIHQNDYNYFG